MGWGRRRIVGLGVGSEVKPNPIPNSNTFRVVVCAVVVSTIAVKRSNKAAALEAGRNGGQTDSTEFHLGQGEAGKGDSLTDLF